ncbi:MAG: head GIN domain-containing protein [Myxococcota bacterium]
MQYALFVAAFSVITPITQSKTVDPFTEVRSSGSAEIELQVDASQTGPVALTISGSQEALERLEISVEDGVLYVSSKQWLGMGGGLGPTIRATVSGLDSVNLNGSGDLRATRLDTDEMVIRTSGSGDVKMSGRIGDLRVSSAGSGDVEVRGVDGSEVSIQIAGSGDTTVEGKAGTLEVSVAGSGDVDGAALRVRDVKASVLGSGDVTVCATGAIQRSEMGSGRVRNKCGS